MDKLTEMPITGACVYMLANKSNQKQAPSELTIDFDKYCLFAFQRAAPRNCRQPHTNSSRVNDALFF